MGIPVSMDIYLTSSSNFLSIVVLIISRLILLFGRPSFLLFGRPIILLFMQVYIDETIINEFYILILMKNQCKFKVCGHKVENFIKNRL